MAKSVEVILSTTTTTTSLNFMAAIKQIYRVLGICPIRKAIIFFLLTIDFTCNIEIFIQKHAFNVYVQGVDIAR